VLLILWSNPDDIQIDIEDEIEVLKCISKLVAASIAFSAYKKKEGIIYNNLLNSMEVLT
jgi:hypothetical protein